jgi:hypothetical protein
MQIDLSHPAAAADQSVTISCGSIDSGSAADSLAETRVLPA